MWDFFWFCLDLELLINLVSVSLQKPGLFKILANISSSKQNKKVPHTFFVDNGK